jgi:hypothetical protein
MATAGVVTVSTAVCAGFLLEHFSESEIEDLDVAVVSDEQILRFQIAMGNALGVRGGQSPGNLAGVGKGLVAGHSGKMLPQGLTFEELRDQIGSAIVRSDVEDGEDIGVVDDAGRAGFEFKPAEAIGVGGKGRGLNLDGHVAPQARVTSAINLAHASCTEGRRSRMVQAVPRR